MEYLLHVVVKIKSNETSPDLRTAIHKAQEHLRIRVNSVASPSDDDERKEFAVNRIHHASDSRILIPELCHRDVSNRIIGFAFLYAGKKGDEYWFHLKLGPLMRSATPQPCITDGGDPKWSRVPHWTDGTRALEIFEQAGPCNNFQTVTVFFNHLCHLITHQEPSFDLEAVLEFSEVDDVYNVGNVALFYEEGVDKQLLKSLVTLPPWAEALAKDVAGELEHLM